ncbi:MAG: ATP-binding protein, partial [Candidatus Sulfotelmatobacter sp.]
MLNQQTIEKLHSMKLHGLADAFRAQLETTEASQLSFEERFALLVDQQWLWKENRALARRLRAAHLKERGVIEDVDYQHPRGLDRKLVRTLCSSDWVRQHQSILLLGPTGIGKSWLACALAQKACRDGFSILHKRTSELFRELAVAHADGSIGRFLVRRPSVADGQGLRVHATSGVVERRTEGRFKIPILARNSGEMVDGHLRLKA